MTDIRTDEGTSVPEPLTEREYEILAHLVEGLSNQEIANRLYLAEKTVRWYNSQIYSKLGVGSRRQAIERAKALGLLETPADASPVADKHNLPAQATPFVGRQRELDEIAALLDDDHTRLVTILAPGGMGKTRLALEAAEMQLGRYADGVIFVPLAPLSSPHDIVTAIAENIGFSFHGENAPVRQLIDFLRERSMLLVLDNFELLLDGAPLLADLVQAAPRVKLLVTSREKLNLSGEIVYTASGLHFPDSETPEDGLRYDAVELFLQSAYRVRPDFEFQSDDLIYLARICRLTEGMPLALVLAAGWVDVLSLEQIAAEIQRSIDILETQLRDVPERQRSVRATFELTWERLTQDEQHMLMRLSAFRGGFTIDSAFAVAYADVRGLRKLVDRALVQVLPDGRHDIHELLRQFAAEKLALSGEQPQMEAKHAAHYADFMAERKQDIRTNRQLEALDLIDPEFENVRAAWRYVVSHQEWEQFPKFLHSLWFHWDVRTRGQEAVELLEAAVKVLGAAPTSEKTVLARARVLARLGWFYNDIGFSERAAATCDEAIRVLRQYESPEDLMAALYSRHLAEFYLNKSEVTLSIAQEGLEIARSMRAKDWEGYFLIWSGWASAANRDFAAAFQSAEAGLEIFEALGDSWGIARAYSLLAQIHLDRQAYDEAAQWLEKRLILAQTFGHFFTIAESYTDQGIIALALRKYRIARHYLIKGLRTFWDAGYKWAAMYPLIYIAQMFAQQKRLDRATKILAAIYVHPPNRRTSEVAHALRDELEAKLEPQRFRAAWARGQERGLTGVVAELLMEGAND